MIQSVFGTRITYVQGAEEFEVGEVYSTREVDEFVRVARRFRYVKVDHVKQRAIFFVVGAPVYIITRGENGVTLDFLPPDQLRVGGINVVHAGNFSRYLGRAVATRLKRVLIARNGFVVISWFVGSAPRLDEYVPIFVHRSG